MKDNVKARPFTRLLLTLLIIARRTRSPVSWSGLSKDIIPLGISAILADVNAFLKWVFEDLQTDLQTGDEVLFQVHKATANSTSIYFARFTAAARHNEAETKHSLACSTAQV